MIQPEAPEDGRDSLTSRLRHVYWIGGASGAGKSTIARRLADKYGLRLYSTDEAMGGHAHRWLPEDCPNLTEWVKMSMDQRWVDRPPQTMLDTFHWFRGEGFGLIIEDLVALPQGQGVIAEGFRLLPHLVKPLLHDPSHSVWLIPTPEFRLAAFESRGTMWTIPNKTSNPKRALSNLLAYVRHDNVALDDSELPVVNRNDGTVSAQMLAAAARFGVADSPRVAAGQIQLCIPGERR